MPWYYFLQKEQLFPWLRRSYIWLVLLLIYIPLIIIILISFNGASAKGNIVLQFNRLIPNNWNNLFKNQEFVEVFINSLLVALFVVPISLLLAIFTCVGMWNNSKKNQKLIGFFSTSNIAIPDIISGISLALLFSSIWLPLGLDLGYWSVAISHISFCTPYALLIIYPRIQTLNQNLINASYDLGASKIRTFWNVIIPHLLPSVMAAIVVVFGISFDDFIITLLTGGNFRTISSTIYLFSKGIKAWIITFSAVLIIIFVLISLVLTLWKTYFGKGEKWFKKSLVT